MFYLSECLIIKNENQYLIEHLTRQIQSGIEHFYIFDNNSNISVDTFLNDYPDLKKLCTIENWNNYQNECYAYFIDKYSKETKWCSFTDTDEMYEGNLLALCKEYENKFAVIYFKGLTHGCNNQAFYDSTKTLWERFYSDIITRWFYRKCVVQTEFCERQTAHYTILKPTQFGVAGQPSTVTLHHFFYKSLEEWILKIKRGVILQNEHLVLWHFFIDNQLPKKEINTLLKKYNINFYFHTGHFQKKI